MGKKNFKRKSYHKDAEKIMNRPDRAHGYMRRERKKERKVQEIKEKGKKRKLVKNSSRHVCRCNIY
jgi:hypothetical protein